MKFSHRLCDAKFRNAPIAIATVRTKFPTETAPRRHERAGSRVAEHDHRGGRIEDDCGCACALLHR